jgi:innexin
MKKDSIENPEKPKATQKKRRGRKLWEYYSVVEFNIMKYSVTITYIFVKILYLSGALLQVYLMNFFLSSRKHSFYGYEIVERIVSGEADLGFRNDSKIFPRVTICDVKTREFGMDHTYSLQCVLSANLLNERIYAFLWFWICCVLVPFCVIDIVAWILRITLRGPTWRYKFIKHRLPPSVISGLTKEQKLQIKVFADYYIGCDGIFILRLLEHNSNAAVICGSNSKLIM